MLIANQEDNLQKMAQEWEMNPDDIKCHGCKTDTLSVYCKTCDIRECARKKNVDFCFQCPEFPCATLRAFRDDQCSHHSVIFKNLKIIQKKGVEKWLQEQKSRWRCAQCGTKGSWYDEECRTCGKTLYSCREEENNLDKEQD